MELKDLEYFITIVDQGSFTKASQYLNVSQPALSQSVRKLEQEFGTIFMHRNTRQIELSSDGKFLYNRGRRLIEEANSIDKHLRHDREQNKKRLRIGISPFYSKFYIPVLLPILNGYSNLDYEIVEDISINLENKLLNKDIDLCFLPRFPEKPNFNYEPICIEEILLAIPEEFDINRMAISGEPLPYLRLSDIKDLPFVSLKKEQKIRTIVDKVCEEAGFVPNIIYETLDWDTVNIMITHGIGIGFVPDILMRKSMGEKKHPVFYRIANKAIRREYSAAWLEDTVLSSDAETIIDCFRDELIRMHQ